MDEFFDVDEYFEEHPEEEAEFIAEMERLHENDEPVDYPEYWVTNEWLKFA